MILSVAIWSVQDLSCRKPACSSLNSESSTILACNDQQCYPFPVLIMCGITFLRQLNEKSLLPLLWDFLVPPDLVEDAVHGIYWHHTTCLNSVWGGIIYPRRLSSLEAFDGRSDFGPRNAIRPYREFFSRLQGKWVCGWGSIKHFFKVLLQRVSCSSTFLRISPSPLRIGFLWLGLRSLRILVVW